MVQKDPAQDGKGSSDPRLDSLDMQLKQVRQAEKIRSGKKDQAPAKGMRQGSHRIDCRPCGWCVARLVFGSVVRHSSLDPTHCHVPWDRGGV